MFKLAGVLVFSAVPFTAVKAVANSPLGESLQRRLEEREKVKVVNASNLNKLYQQARMDSFDILHARWAMLAALCPLIPESLNLLGAFNFIEPVWWSVGYNKLQEIQQLSLTITISYRDSHGPYILQL
ncbi:hypothetical protein DCAR_0103248 [Daucus carota subsp. sativus]|uniref:Chlorophyll a-b binding protein, chloroplastic n=1 Tax=Daucus carota subsp. sativus TaxID=79200 RepID=A0AAF0W9F6_DAUCS|nr:PREDICTED: uncharacterized protein LOC108201838 isoform X2 [Daucus carota subsp. sativus]WOG84068.1 hypothetical protein DCAR_0103248 [Daucus carota subsp. sativus]